jgi:hypothetical protein
LREDQHEVRARLALAEKEVRRLRRERHPRSPSAPS